MDDTYRLVFRAEVLEGQHRAVVKKRLVQALKLSEQQAEQLFSGNPVVVKKAADTRTAARYQALFKQAGARLRVMPVAQGSRTVESVGQGADEPPGEAAGAPSADPPRADMTALPAGSDLLSDAERVRPPPVSVSTDHLSIAEPGTVLAETRRLAPSERLVDVSFDVAEVGADLATAREAPRPSVVLDEIDFDVAEVGADIGQTRAQDVPPAPDVSHLSVAGD